MAKGRWVKDSCPYAKDQGFNSVIGDVRPGETVFGFSITTTSTSHTCTLKTVTAGLVTQMDDTNYRILVTKVSAGSVVTVPTTATKTKTSFILQAENAEDYDVIVIGRVLY